MPDRRILMIKPSALGDVVHALPVLRLLRRRFPGAQISWLVARAFAGLLEDHPDLDQVITFDRHELARTWYRPEGMSGLLRLRRRLREMRFDTVIDLQGLLRSGILGWMSGAEERFGFREAREMAWLGYNRPVSLNGREMHAVDRYVAVARELGCEPGPIEFRFNHTDADRQWAREQTGGRNYCVLLPGTNWATKRWPIGSFASLSRRIEKETGLAAVVCGAGDARALVEAIGPGRCVDLVGKTSLRQLVAVLEQAAMVVANDTGPMHIAAALGRPLVTLFGPTNPARTGPYGRPETVVRAELPCSPCYSRRCVHQSCMTLLKVDAVFEAVRRQLAAGSVQA
jgi:heptosyltransferase-1